jgi:pyrroline-5-carboxylate reductase
MLKNKKIGLIGTGKIGETILSALINSNKINLKNIIASVKQKNRIQELEKKLKIKITINNTEVVKYSDIIIIATKPQNVKDVLNEIKDIELTEKLIISVAASVTTEFIQQNLKQNTSIIRAMPNTPCLISKGMTAIARGGFTKDNDLLFAESIFKLLGRTKILDEKYMDAVTGLSASGPAFIYIVIESLTEAGVKVGLPRDVAQELAAQMVFGASSMVLETGEHPALLKDVVTTPAGCTIDGILELEEGKLRVTLIKAVVKATERAKQLIIS